jgi:RNA polymerase sigma factor (sigma-70 family)
MSMKSGRVLEGPSVPSNSCDSGAFGAFFLKWRPVLLSLAQGILSDADHAEDVAQCILTRLWATGAWTEIAWPGAYIRQAARREALKMRQKRRRWASLGHPELLAFPSGGPDPAEAVEKQEFLECLEDRLGELPPRCGLVMALTHLQGLTHSETAERLEVSEKAVEKQVRRGRDHLRNLLVREDDGSVSWLSRNSEKGGEGNFGGSI